jgi:succinate dehydrogenase / fumarate reductase cytochrome b subunit
MSKLNKKKMPLSPHLGIYKWQINSVLSILHRLSGASLYFFLLIFFWLFSLNVFYENCHMLELINNFLEKNILGKLFISGVSFLIYYHMLNGIRHLFWDMGYGFEIRSMQISGIITVICALIISVFTFLFIYF